MPILCQSKVQLSETERIGTLPVIKIHMFTFKLLILCYHSLHVIGFLTASLQKFDLFKIQQSLAGGTSTVQSPVKCVCLFRCYEDFIMNSLRHIHQRYQREEWDGSFCVASLMPIWNQNHFIWNGEILQIKSVIFHLFSVFSRWAHSCIANRLPGRRLDNPSYVLRVRFPLHPHQKFIIWNPLIGK